LSEIHFTLISAVVAPKVIDPHPFWAVILEKGDVVAKNDISPVTNMFELKGDDNLKNELDTPRFHDVFLMLVVKTFRKYVTLKADGGQLAVPLAVTDARKNWLSSEDGSAIGKFLTDFELTNNPNDFTPNKVIKAWHDTKQTGVTPNKLSAELKKHCHINNLTNCKGDQQKKCGRQNLKGWRGVKMYENEEDNEHNDSNANTYSGGGPNPRKP
jgi:hypothetical protein